MTGTTIEAIRTSYRPQRITTLFVGESAPVSGKFFYIGNTLLARHVERAMNEAGLGGGGNFLDRFKSYGWYLDDLVLNPVNHLTPPQRAASDLALKAGLEQRGTPLRLLLARCPKLLVRLLPIDMRKRFFDSIQKTFPVRMSLTSYLGRYPTAPSGSARRLWGTPCRNRTQATYALAFGLATLQELPAHGVGVAFDDTRD